MNDGPAAGARCGLPAVAGLGFLPEDAARLAGRARYPCMNRD